MLTVNVICVGKLKEKFYLAAVEEYSKRLSRSCKLNLLELPEERLPEPPSDAQIEAALRKEFQLIQSKLPKGGVVLRNFWNPSDPYNQDKTDRWHKAVVSNTARLEKGIVDVEFPRDRNDFMPAREGVYLHNVRHITKPEVKDVRTFL